jgi:hypothetical protein
MNGMTQPFACAVFLFALVASAPVRCGCTDKAKLRLGARLSSEPDGASKKDAMLPTAAAMPTHALLEVGRPRCSASPSGSEHAGLCRSLPRIAPPEKQC